MTWACTAMTPTALTGDLKPLQCTLLNGSMPHRGQHRATRTVPNVGKVIYRWKRSRHFNQPPVVVLPAAVASMRRSMQGLTDAIGRIGR